MDKSKLLSLASPSKRKPQRDEDHSPEATERRKKFRKSRPQSDDQLSMSSIHRRDDNEIDERIIESRKEHKKAAAHGLSEASALEETSDQHTKHARKHKKKDKKRNEKDDVPQRDTPIHPAEVDQSSQRMQAMHVPHTDDHVHAEDMSLQELPTSEAGTSKGKKKKSKKHKKLKEIEKAQLEEAVEQQIEEELEENVPKKKKKKKNQKEPIEQEEGERSETHAVEEEQATPEKHAPQKETTNMPPKTQSDAVTSTPKKPKVLTGLMYWTTPKTKRRIKKIENMQDTAVDYDALSKTTSLSPSPQLTRSPKSVFRSIVPPDLSKPMVVPEPTKKTKEHAIEAPKKRIVVEGRSGVESTSGHQLKHRIVSEKHRQSYEPPSKHETHEAEPTVETVLQPTSELASEQLGDRKKTTQTRPKTPSSESEEESGEDGEPASSAESYLSDFLHHRYESGSGSDHSGENSPGPSTVPYTGPGFDFDDDTDEDDSSHDSDQSGYQDEEEPAQNEPILPKKSTVSKRPELETIPETESSGASAQHGHDDEPAEPVEPSDIGPRTKTSTRIFPPSTNGNAAGPPIAKKTSSRLPAQSQPSSAPVKPVDSEPRTKTSGKPTTPTAAPSQPRKTSNKRPVPSTSNRRKIRPPQRRNQIPRPKRINRVERDIRILQSSINMVIPKLPFQRVVREIMQRHDAYLIQSEALFALQTAAEMIMNDLFADSMIITYRARRLTLQAGDVQAARWIKNCPLLGRPD